jgi:hypothetical protein
MSLQFIGNVWINLQLVLLLSLSLPQVYATTFVQFGDTAGVIYPTIEEGNIFLKEAYLQIDTISKWERETAGFEPHHAIEMNFNAEYVIQNDSEETNLPINIPLMTPLDDSSLSFTFNELAVNYSNVEYANLRQTGTGVNLYTLDLTVPEGTSVLEVNATSRGIAGSETDFTIMLEEVSRWPKPIEKLVVSSTHVNGLITSYSIPPSKTTLKAATWNLSNNVPAQDLTIRWKITQSPIGTDIDVSKLQPPDPLIPPIIAIIVGGAIIGFIAYIRVKRKRSGSVN